MARRSIRWLLGRSLDARVWRPAHALYLRDQVTGLRRNERAGFSDHDHLVSAAHWLARAQDATGDGGVSGRYSLRTGWSSSYPETTGYIIPTLIALGKELDPAFRERAARCVEFLRGIQLSNGAFPGGELHENRTRPSIFNTAQILNGLVAWHAETADKLAGDSATRAAEWLTSQQDTDGCWRGNIYNGVTTYTAHASCWLAQAGKHFAVGPWLTAAERHLDWVLSHVDRSTGWIDLAGFDTEDHESRRAPTHTIAYTVWGLLDLSVVLGRDDGLSAARTAAERIARRLELSGWLPGELDSQWKPAAEYSCLTGNAQMALIWFRLAGIDGDARFTNAAIKALDLVKAAQSMENADPGIRGGIPGSAPAWGKYLYMGLPNWSAKFFIDALLAKRDALACFARTSSPRWILPADIPRALPALTKRPGSPVRLVMLSAPGSHKVSQMARAWGIRPDAVVIEHRTEPSLFTRLLRKIRNDGIIEASRDAIAQRLPARRRQPESQTVATDAVAYCEGEGIPIVHLGPLSHPDAITAVRSLAPDLLVHAGAGILRRELLAIPRLGTLNVHMGILPRYRGMNVAEWACLEGNPVGCTVHLVNAGIDTGDIVAVDEVDTRSINSIAALRASVDDAQIALLGDVISFVLKTGVMPDARTQTLTEGRQYFEMHRDLKEILETRLKAGRPTERPRQSSSAPSVAAAVATT
jgi:folate-dependent phosphoribosylglycinamide formyltransferase PurN